MVRKIIFEHKRALGDAVMFSAGVRDFKLLFPDILINVSTNQPEVFKNNPYIDVSLKIGDEGVEYYKVGYPAIGNVNNSTIHYTNMFLFDMIAVADLHNKLPIGLGEFCAVFANGTVGDPSLGDKVKNSSAKEPFISLRNKYEKICEKFSRQRGDLHLTQEEKNNNIIKNVYDIDKYWVIAPGGKRDCTVKIWDWRKFQDVIDYFEGKIKFVVIGKSDLLVEPLKNVIDLTDRYNKDLRGLFSLVYNAEGCVSGPSALMHIAAAVPPRYKKERKPCVDIWGGREPSTWSWYCNHQILHTNGAFTCCDNGGCWKARTYPIAKDIEHNKSLCDVTVKVDGRTVQACMNSITSQDVIRAIEKYYEGNIYKFDKTSRKKIKKEQPKEILNDCVKSDEKEINLLGNLNTAGGGEQSLLTIAKVLRRNGWKVNLYPWGEVHKNYKKEEIMPSSYKTDLLEKIKPGLPLLFYANDCIWDFCKTAEPLIQKVSSLIIGINFCNGSLPRCTWLANNPKFKGIIFQNQEKKEEFDRDCVGFENVKRVVLFGAIELDSMLEVCTAHRKDADDSLVILKHCVADYRKYVTTESAKNGERIHLWQKCCEKETDIKFYSRLLKDTKNTKFEFMEAHDELVKFFKNEPRMVFHKWDSMPVTKFLSRGHIYLYRTSNMWRDNYPRVMAEALAAGLPILGEPRDGPKDRIQHGDTGFYCVDYDAYLYAIKLLQRKEDYRKKMAVSAKEWAKKNLNPNKWDEVIEEIVYGSR